MVDVSWICGFVCFVEGDCSFVFVWCFWCGVVEVVGDVGVDVFG